MFRRAAVAGTKGLLKVPYFKGRDRLLSLMRPMLPPTQRARFEPGFVLDLDLGEWSQWSLLAHPYEPSTCALFERLLRPGDRVVDVGAHVGYLSLLASVLVGPGGRVLSLEVQPENAARFLHNVQLNAARNVELHVVAASDEAGFVQLRMQDPSDRSRLSLEDPEPNALATTFHVAKARLDTLLEWDGVRLLKIDVEGHEASVLEGLGDRHSSVDHIVCELLPTQPKRAEAVASWLQERGFALKTVAGRPWAPGQSLPESNLWAERNQQAKR